MLETRFISNRGLKKRWKISAFLMRLPGMKPEQVASVNVLCGDKKECSLLLIPLA